MKETLKTIIIGLVDDKEAVEVSEKNDEQSVVL